MNKTSKNSFDLIIYFIVGLSVLLCIVPFVNIIAMSLSSETAIVSGRVYLWPSGWNWQPYRAILNDSTMIRSLIVTISITVTFTVLSMFMTVMAAYPLSRSKLPGKNIILMLIVFTMFFSGGLIPDYLLIKQLAMTNTVWSLIVPGLINAFYLLIMVTFFRNVPSSLEESAKIDGASYFVILTRIFLPLSLPAIATLSLFYAVGRWNGFMDALFYIFDSKLYPIQLKLYQMVMNNQLSNLTMQEGMNEGSLTPEGLKSATLIFGTLPILLVYPFLQRFFINGMTLGAVKE